MVMLFVPTSNVEMLFGLQKGQFVLYNMIRTLGPTNAESKLMVRQIL